MYINVYKGDDNFVTSGATLLSDLDLQETYKAIDSVATGRIPSLFCALVLKKADYKIIFLCSIEQTQ